MQILTVSKRIAKRTRDYITTISRAKITRSWLLGTITAILCLVGFPFFAYRIIDKVDRGAVIHTAFVLVNICAWICALIFPFLAAAILDKQSLNQHWLGLIGITLAIPISAFLATSTFIVFDIFRKRTESRKYIAS